MNKRASIMVLREDSSGHITGKYRSSAGRDLQVRELAGRTSRLDGDKQMVGSVFAFTLTSPPRSSAMPQSVRGRVGYEIER